MIDIENINITPEMLTLIAKIDEFKGIWQSLGNLAPERLTSLRHVATIESIGSSTRIEGSKLSDREVEKLLSNIAIQSFSGRDEQEVAGYAKTMELIFLSWREISLTENHIKQLHRDLLSYSDKDERHRGNYKTASNNVVAFDADGKQIGIVFETASPFDTPRLMQELTIWFRNTQHESSLHPLLAISIFVVSFLAIHPFQDGNGRLSRILTTLLLLQTGYAYVPYCSLESIIEHNKENYYLALRRTQTTIRAEKTDWNPWNLFFLRALKQQTEKLLAKVKKEKMMLADLPELSLKILEHVKEHGRLTIGEITRLTGANRNTLKEHLRSLTKNNYLALHGHGRGAWYTLS